MEVAINIFTLLLHCLSHVELANSETQIVPEIPLRSSVGGIHDVGGADKLLHASFPSEADTLAYVDALKHSNFSQWRSLEEVAKRAGGGSCSGAVNTSVLTALYLLGLFNLCTASPASCCIPPQTDRRRRRSFVPDTSEDNAELPQLLDSLKLNLSSLSLEQFGDLPHVSSPNGGRIPVHISVVEQVRKLWDSNPRLLSNIHCRTATEAVRSSFISLSGVASGIILAYSIAQLNQCYPHQQQKEYYQNIWFFPIPRQAKLPNQQKVRSLPTEMPVKGKDDPDDGCDRTSVRLDSRECAKVFSTEDCPYMSWVLLNRETGLGECVPRICFSGKVFVEFDQMCHDVNEPGFCPERQRLYLTAWGEAVCDCIDGTFYGPDGNCHRLYEQAYCYKGTVLQFHKPSKTLVCKADSCQNLNSNLLKGDLPYAKDEAGSCHQFSSIGPCEADQRFGFDVEALKPACVSLEQAGITQPPKSYHYSHMSFPSSAGASVPHYEVSYVILNGSTWELMMRNVGREKRDAQNSEKNVIQFFDTREFPTNMEEILPGLEELSLIEEIKQQIKNNSENKGTVKEGSFKSLEVTRRSLEKAEQFNISSKQNKSDISVANNNIIVNNKNLQLTVPKKTKRRRLAKENIKGGNKRKRKTKSSLKKKNNRSNTKEKSSGKNRTTKSHTNGRQIKIDNNNIKSTAFEKGEAGAKALGENEEFSSNLDVENKTEIKRTIKHNEQNVNYQNSTQKSSDSLLKNITVLVSDAKKSVNSFNEETNKLFAEVYFIKNEIIGNSVQQILVDKEISADHGFIDFDQMLPKTTKNKTEIILGKLPQLSYNLANKPPKLSTDKESMIPKNQEIDFVYGNNFKVTNNSNTTCNNDSVTTETSIDNHDINSTVINVTNLLEQLGMETINAQMRQGSETENENHKINQSELNMNTKNEYFMAPFTPEGSLELTNISKNNESESAEYVNFMINANASKFAPPEFNIVSEENNTELVQVSAITVNDTTNLLNGSKVYQVNTNINDSLNGVRSDFMSYKNKSNYDDKHGYQYISKTSDMPETNSINRNFRIQAKNHTVNSTSQIPSFDGVRNFKYCNTSEINILKSVTDKLGDNFELQENVSRKINSPTFTSTPSTNAKTINITAGELTPTSDYSDIKVKSVMSPGLQLYFNEDKLHNEETINKEDNRIHLLVEKRIEQISQESERKEESMERDLHKKYGIIKVQQTDLKPQLNVPSIFKQNRNATIRTLKKKNERDKKQKNGTKKVGKGKRGRKQKKSDERKKNEVIHIIISETSGNDNIDKTSVTKFDNTTLKEAKSTRKGNIEEDSLPDYLRNRDRRQAGSKRVGKTIPGIINAPLLNQCRPGAKRDYNGHCRPKVIPEDDVPATRRPKELSIQPSLPRIKCEGTSRLDARGVCRTTFSGLG